MPLTTTGKNNLISVTAMTHAGALTDIASTPTEVSGGSYARQAITWASASSGTRANTGDITIPIPASTTVVAVGVWNASTAGTLQGFWQIGSTINGVGTATASSETIASFAHGLSNTDRVFVTAPAGSTLPAGLSVTTLYFVVGATTDSFQLSLTSGGSAENITANGEVAFFRTVPQVFSSAGNLILPTSTGLVIDVTAFG
jgi:hypothetical protein